MPTTTETTPAATGIAALRAAADAAGLARFEVGPGAIDPTDPAAGPQTGIMLALIPPPELAAAIARPDGTPADAMHLTLVTFPFSTDDATPEQLDAIRSAAQACAGCEGFTVTLTHGSWFGPELATYALEGNVPEAAELRSELTDQLTAAGVPWSNDYAFRLHLTIGDYPQGDPVRDQLTVGALAEPVTFDATSFVVSIGEDQTTVPLGPPETEDDDPEPDPADPAEGGEPAEPADGAGPMPGMAASPPVLVPAPGAAPEDDEEDPNAPAQRPAAAALAAEPADAGPIPETGTEVVGPDAEPAGVVQVSAALWSSPCIAPFGVTSGDGRRIVGPVRFRPMPLPYAATWTIAPEHNGAGFAGNILTATNTPAGIAATGDFDLGRAEGAEAYRLAATGRCNTVSVDLTDVTVEITGIDPVNDPLGEAATLDVLDAELIGVTGVMHPAFAQARIGVLAAGAPPAAQRAEAPGLFGSHRLAYGALAASGGGFAGPPVALSILGPSGNLVATGTPIAGHPYRFHVDRLSFVCGSVPVLPQVPARGQQLEPATLPPVEVAVRPVLAAGGAGLVMGAGDTLTMGTLTTTGTIISTTTGVNGTPAAPRGVAGGLTLVAGAGPAEPDHLDDAFLAHPPARWFAPLPDARGPVRMLSRAGEFGGLVARWTDCHVGFADRCVPPPRSRTGYRAFATGELLTAEGTMVAVGPMFADTVHPSLALAASDAYAHYADTGCLVLQVAAGENEHGIWVHGAAMPELSGRQLRVLAAGRWSGDWRPMRESSGWPELLSVLAVNGPGFPTPALAAAGSPDTEGLVAAGRPGALALFDSSEQLVAGVGLGLVAAGDPCETAEQAVATLAPTGIPAELSAAVAQLFGDLAARLELVAGWQAEVDQLLEPMRAQARATLAADLLARMAAARNGR